MTEDTGQLSARVNLETLEQSPSPSGWPNLWQAYHLEPLHWYSLLFTLSILAFSLKYFVSDTASMLRLLLSITSCVGCGLAWLLSRELFKKFTQRPLWPEILVGCLFVIAAVMNVLEARFPGLTTSSLAAMLYKLMTLISSTVLLLPLVEATEGLRALENNAERRFRLIFASSYGLLLGISLATSLPGLVSWQGEIKMGLAFFGLVGFAKALVYRTRHPLLETCRPKPRKKLLSLESDPAIAAKIKTQLEEQQVFLDAELKVADLAARIGEQEYKVTQAITGDLQFRNFNQMINTYRIEHAKKLIADPNQSQCSILTIAMESGFNSVGPFNRAFKALVGKTPSEYRLNPSAADHSVEGS